jgi:hypothetical protein
MNQRVRPLEHRASQGFTKTAHRIEASSSDIGAPQAK